MRQELRPSGLESAGDLPWGSHFCQFYGERTDLVDTLVPFFKAGLEANEKCLWVTCEPLRSGDAAVALRNAVPDVQARIDRGQLEILDHDEWYLRTGRADADATLRGWVVREQQARAEGFDGLRLTGNTFFVERNDWTGFVDYESRVSRTFAGQNIIGLCSYCLGRCQPHDILDVVANHQFALTRRNGEWQLLENASLKMAKAELARLNADLEQRVLERTDALERAVASRDEFLSVASHELKTPITSLQLNVQGLLRAAEKGTLAPDQILTRAGKLQEQCRRLEKLVNNLLDVSRVDARGPSLHREEMELGALLLEAADRFAEEFARVRCRVTFDVPAPVVGHWDRMRLEQVFANLFQNVVRYAPGSNVRLSVRDGRDRAELRVADDGPGIAATEHERIFERFCQAEGPRAFSGGFGLGLWIVRQVAEAHGGSARVESAPGAGATFIVELPTR